jgi:YD repeat-containing protein
VYAHDLDGDLQASTRQTLRDDRLLAALDAPGDDYSGRAYTVDWEPPAGERFVDHLADELDPAPFEISGVHDALGRRTRAVTPMTVDGRRRTLDFGYDPSGRVTSVALGDKSQVERVAYDARGRRILVARANGVMTRLSYKPLTLRLARLRSESYRLGDLTYTPTGGSALQDLAYAYDLTGNVLAIDDRTPGSGFGSTPDALDRGFQYDALYRLVCATGRESGPAPSDPWDPGPRTHDITLVTAYTEAYTYDAVDNLTSQTHDHAGTTWVRTFEAAGDGNRLVGMTTGGMRYAYATDRCGNLTSDTTSRLCEWDASNRLQTRGPDYTRRACPSVGCSTDAAASAPRPLPTTRSTSRRTARPSRGSAPDPPSSGTRRLPRHMTSPTTSAAVAPPLTTRDDSSDARSIRPTVKRRSAVIRVNASVRARAMARCARLAP